MSDAICISREGGNLPLRGTVFLKMCMNVHVTQKANSKQIHIDSIIFAIILCTFNHAA